MDDEAAATGAGGSDDEEEDQDQDQDQDQDLVGTGPGAGAAPAGAPQDEQELLETLQFEERQQRGEVLRGLSGVQLERYLAARRSTLKDKSVERVMRAVLGEAARLDPAAVCVVAGWAKMFVAELVEEAGEVRAAAAAGGGGSIRPHHLREAQRRLKRRRLV